MGWRVTIAQSPDLTDLGCLQGRNSSYVDLGLDFSELAGNMGSVAIEDGAVTVGDLTGMVKNDNLSIEGDGFSGGVVLGIRADVTSSDILDGDTLNVESDVVTGNSFGHRFVMHFD